MPAPRQRSRRALRPARHPAQQRRHPVEPATRRDHRRRLGPVDDGQRQEHGAGRSGGGAAHARPTGGGSIINISSIAGLRAYPARSTAYTTSKAAVVGLTMALAGQLGGKHIRVNCIAPGQVFTPLVAERLDAEGRQRRATSGLIKDEGSAWDIAWAAVYLASDEARWVTGQVLAVDAGHHHHHPRQRLHLTASAGRGSACTGRHGCRDCGIGAGYTVQRHAVPDPWPQRSGGFRAGARLRRRQPAWPELRIVGQREHTAGAPRARRRR